MYANERSKKSETMITFIFSNEVWLVYVFYLQFYEWIDNPIKKSCGNNSEQIYL